MMDDVVKWGRIFHVLCIVFAAVSILAGCIALFYSFQISSQLGSSVSDVNGAVSASSAILSNVAALASTEASSSQALSQNLTATLGNFSNINGVPALDKVVNNTLSHMTASLSNIAQETSTLNYTLSSLADTYRSDIGSVQTAVPLLLLGFGVYAILQGVIFLVLGRISSYLIGSTLKPKGKTRKKQSAEAGKSVVAQKSAEALQNEEEEEERGKGKGNLGIIGGIKDALGIE